MSITEVEMDRQQLAGWLGRYVEAWKSYDRNLIEELFSEEAVYRYYPWDDEPSRGRGAIASKWLEDRDEPGTYDATYEPAAVDGDVAVATGTSTYFAGDGSVDRIYDNCFVMRFEDAGRCLEFTEWYMKRH
jgi:SnoaL-like domain